MDKRAALTLIGFLLVLLIVVVPVNAEDSPQGTSPETLQDAAKEPPQEIPQLTAGDTARETPQDPAQETPQQTDLQGIWDVLVNLQQMINDIVSIVHTLDGDVDRLHLQNVWVHPLIAYPRGPHGTSTTMISTRMCDASTIPCAPAALEITTDSGVSEEDYQWIIFPLTLPDGATISGVRINYYINASDPSDTYISETCLAQMTTPDLASVMMDDTTDLFGPGSGDHTSYASYTVEGANDLELKVVIGDPADSIVIGGIEIYMKK